MQKFNVTILFIVGLAAFEVSAQTTDSVASGVQSWKDLKWQKSAAQTTALVLAGSTTSLSGFHVFAIKLSPSQKFRGIDGYSHAEQMIIVKEGNLCVTVPGDTTVLGRGGVAYIMAGDPYSVGTARREPVTCYVLVYKSKLPEDLQRAKLAGGSFLIEWDKVPYTKNEKGARKNFFNRATSQLQKFEMHTTALNAGLHSHAPHTHKEEEIILILRGKVKMHIAGKLTPAVPGDVVFLSSGVSHALLNTGSEQVEYFAFQWSN
jgi:(S)-ureidoglycine aminohydrolase